ncbi:hypothetical protein OKA05_00375 [Luteolibacter arcticus]|uniref:Uncharacterized protein n=1 Tax=Luteolibacter arcticus TaxID=1581411 RepID=A0ABT3GBI3_9BACT|nr:hypothetical protein [Luteolibacter arcticus]MCW1920987.1 hypothetical protein [Luteolibacter arcticus]
MYAIGMRSSGGLLKVLALCSTVALGGGYVWWSQKKSEDSRAKEAEAYERMILPGPKSAGISGEGSGLKLDLPEDPRTNADSIQPVPAYEPGRTILPGSKSGLVLPPDDEKKEPPPKLRTVLPGSKSIDPILSPDKAEEEP